MKFDFHRLNLRQIWREFLDANLISVDTELNSCYDSCLVRYFVDGGSENCCIFLDSHYSLLLSLLGVFTCRSGFPGLALLLSL